jgi:hypothetical protein
MIPAISTHGFQAVKDFLEKLQHDTPQGHSSIPRIEYASQLLNTWKITDRVLPSYNLWDPPQLQEATRVHGIGDVNDHVNSLMRLRPNVQDPWQMLVAFNNS